MVGHLSCDPEEERTSPRASEELLGSRSLNVRRVHACHPKSCAAHVKDVELPPSLTSGRRTRPLENSHRLVHTVTFSNFPCLVHALGSIEHDLEKCESASVPGIRQLNAPPPVWFISV